MNPRKIISHFSFLISHLKSVPLHPHFGKSGAFDDVNRPVIRQADASERCYCKHLITNKTMYLDQAKKAEIFGQYGKDAKDTGSVESQVALFTYRIQHLTEHLKKNHKDVVSSLSTFTTRTSIVIVNLSRLSVCVSNTTTTRNNKALRLQGFIILSPLPVDASRSRAGTSVDEVSSDQVRQQSGHHRGECRCRLSCRHNRQTHSCVHVPCHALSVVSAAAPRGASSLSRSR